MGIFYHGRWNVLGNFPVPRQVLFSSQAQHAHSIPEVPITTNQIDALINPLPFLYLHPLHPQQMIHQHAIMQQQELLSQPEQTFVPTNSSIPAL